jgi:general secretion pathway protein D
MSRFLKKGIIIILMPFLFYCVAGAQKKAINVQELELSAVIEYFSKMWNKAIIPDDNLLNSLKNRKASVILPPIENAKNQSEEHWRLVFEKILAIYGYALIETGTDSPSGGIFRLIQKKNAIKMPTPFYNQIEGKKLDNSREKIITQVLVMKYINTDAVRPFFRYVSSIAPPMVLPDKKTLIVTTHESELKYFLSLIEFVDIESEKPFIKIYRLKRADPTVIQRNASQYINILKTRRNRGNNPATAAYFMPDVPSNRLLVSAITSEHKIIQQFVDFFEAEVKTEKRDIVIYRLKNSDSEEIAKKLDQILKARRGTPKAGAKGAEEDIPAIVPYKELNALIISVKKRETLQAVIDVIELIDVKRAQVFISSTIIEVQHSNNFNFGTDFGFRVKPQQGKIGVVGGSSLGIGTPTFDQNAPESMTITPSLNNFTLAVPYGAYNVIPFVLNAAKANTNLNVVANPTVVCDDNEKATIKITEERAFTQSTIGTGGQQSVTHGGFHEAGIVLNITPSISSDDFLRLQIEQNVDRFIPSSSGRDVRNKREVSITVTIPNKTSVVIGGLTQEQRSDDSSKVPLLSSIPLLGKMFQRKGEEYSQSTLYFFITPEIITSFSEMALVSNRFHDKLKEQASEALQNNPLFKEVNNKTNIPESENNKESMKPQSSPVENLKKVFTPANLYKWVKKSEFLKFAATLMDHNNDKNLEVMPEYTQPHFELTSLDNSFFSTLDNAKQQLDKLSPKEKNKQIKEFNTYLINTLGDLSMRGQSGKKSNRSFRRQNSRKTGVIDVPLPKK